MAVPSPNDFWNVLSMGEKSVQRGPGHTEWRTPRFSNVGPQSRIGRRVLRTTISVLRNYNFEHFQFQKNMKFSKCHNFFSSRQIDLKISRLDPDNVFRGVGNHKSVSRLKSVVRSTLLRNRLRGATLENRGSSTLYGLGPFGLVILPLEVGSGAQTFLVP